MTASAPSKPSNGNRSREATQVSFVSCEADDAPEEEIRHEASTASLSQNMRAARMCRKSFVDDIDLLSLTHTPDDEDNDASMTKSDSDDSDMDSSAEPKKDVEILVVGVMRTGFHPLAEALKMMGFSNIWDQEQIVSGYDQWDDVMENRATPDTFQNIFSGKQVVMGMPIFCFWEQILDAYPHARVILTVRDEDEWWHSVERIKAEMGKDGEGSMLSYGPAMRKLEQFLVPSYHKFSEILRFAWGCTLGPFALDPNSKSLNEATTRTNFRKHNNYVKSVLGSQTMPNGEPRLLVYDVHNGWEPLCKFLQKEIPVAEFPSVRAVPFFPGTHSEGSSSQPLVDELLVPVHAFGETMRKELRTGLLILVVGLTLVLVLLIFMTFTHFITVPLTPIIFLYVGIALVIWSTYVVVHSLVMRVPTVMVLPMAMKSLLIASMLHATFLSYGVLKEHLVTRDAIASPVLVFASRFASVACGAGFLLVSEGRLVFGAPLRDFLAFASTNEISTWAGYEMLKYVSFPVQVMAKSCKMLPTMLMGTVMGVAEYTWYQYVQGIGALVCVAIMHFTENPDHNHSSSTSKSAVSLEDSESVWKACLGSVLLIVFFTADSFTSQFQSALYKRNKELTQTRMMLAGNIVGLIISSVSLGIRWRSATESAAKAWDDPGIFWRICGLGVCGAMGQFCIYYAIKVLGPLSFTWIMTARQLLSVLISLVWFGHGVSIVKIICILIVFAIMSSRQLAKVLPKNPCCRQRLGSHGSHRNSGSLNAKND